MKIKFYASLFIGIGLTLVATPSLAKNATAAKTPTISPAKAVKSTPANGKKSEPKKTTMPVTTKQNTSHQIASKHDKTDNRADHKHGKVDSDNDKHSASKDAGKHGKNKTHEVTENKHDKSSKVHHDIAKDSKQHASRDKPAYFADNNDKHSRKKAHPSTGKTNTEEDSATAVYEEEPSIDHNSATDGATMEPERQNTNASPLFFPPLAHDNPAAALPDKHTPASDMLFDNTPIAPNNTAAPAIATNRNSQRRVHTLIEQGATPQTSSNTVEQDSEEQDPEAATMPSAPPNKRLHSTIARHNNNFIANGSTAEASGQVASAHGIVDTSLDEAGEKAGLSNEMIVELTDVFAWDIDFANNLQTGDEFTVIYEQTATGKTSNRIIGAQFVNNGKTYTAIRYKDQEGMVSYYTPEGRSLRKAFLSTPVDFARVTSHFSTHRLHPILNRIRAHKGVDYAARVGTPVKAAGDGVITFHGTQGGYGRMIVISHGDRYETAYAHLSDYRSNLQDGEPVKQGDVIGYVGQSGLATGPHLHYEFRVDGEHRDPESIDTQQATGLTREDWQMFHTQTMPVLTQINQAKTNSAFAKNL